MRATIRTTLALLLGIIAMVITISCIEQFNHWLNPPPLGFEWQDSSAASYYLRELSVLALVGVLVGWAFGICVGMAVATLVAGKPRGRFVLVITFMVLAGAAANFYLLPHPLWLVVSTFIVLPAIGFACWRVARLWYLQRLIEQRRKV